MYRLLRWITVAALIVALLMLLTGQLFMAMLVFMVAVFIFAAVTASILKDAGALLDNHHQQLKAQMETFEIFHSSLNDIRELLATHQRWLESIAPEPPPPEPPS